MDYLGWSLALLGLGFLFLALEFFIPSAGVLIALCTASIVGSIILAFREGLTQGTAVLVTVLIAIPAALAAGVRYWPHTMIGRMILIKPPETPDEVLPTTQAYRSLKGLVGQRGMARSVMLPSGVVEIDRIDYDAVSAGMAIDPGQPILVIGVETGRLVVRPDISTIVADFADAPRVVQLPDDPLAADFANPFEEDTAK